MYLVIVLLLGIQFVLLISLKMLYMFALLLKIELLKLLHQVLQMLRFYQ